MLFIIISLSKIFQQFSFEYEYLITLTPKICILLLYEVAYRFELMYDCEKTVIILFENIAFFRWISTS